MKNRKSMILKEKIIWVEFLMKGKIRVENIKKVRKMLGKDLKRNKVV